jgi:membrane peptidoglycan carboxypeptidase
LQHIGLGVKLTLSYSKSHILVMYLNVIYYGNGHWGDVTAARGYLGTSPGRLDWAEAAMLAGLPQAPSAYDPDTHFALAKKRQREVLDQLVVTITSPNPKPRPPYREAPAPAPLNNRIMACRYRLKPEENH